MSTQGAEVHVYTRGHQPATRYRVTIGDDGHWFTRRRTSFVWTSCCHRRRLAAHCTTQVYYDQQPFWCREGRGCKVPSRRQRVTRVVLQREFMAGRSMLALARKYGQPRLEIEQRLRRAPATEPAEGDAR